MRSDDTIPAGIPAFSGEATSAPVAAHPLLQPAPCALLAEVDGATSILELPEGRSVLGAGLSASLQIEAPGLADEHLVFERSGASVVATALAALRHNGSPASRAVLGSGDTLTAGDLRLRFVESEDAILAREQTKETGMLWWAVAGWAAGYLGVFILVTAGLIGPAVATLEAAAPAAAATPAPPTAAPSSPDDRAVGVDREEAMPGEAAIAEDEHPQAAAAAPSVEAEPAGEEDPAAPLVEKRLDVPARAVAALPRQVDPSPRSRQQTPAKRLGPGGRGKRRGELVERMVAAWQGGAIEEVVAMGEGAADVEVHRLAMLVRRFSRATERARRLNGIAAAPDLEEALGIAEEIGRDAPPVQDVRRALSALHRSAARRAEERGDLEGAVHHAEQALAIRPGDPEAREIRRSLAARARPIYLDGYALQHLDPTTALRLFERARLLALPDDPTGTRAAALAAKMRSDAGGSGAGGL